LPDDYCHALDAFQNREGGLMHTLINLLFVVVMAAYSLLLGCLWVAFVAVTVPICLVIGAVSSVVEWIIKKVSRHEGD
jgi:putative effector of murein hydrolase LrgA (UPF0299 family)